MFMLDLLQVRPQPIWLIQCWITLKWSICCFGTVTFCCLQAKDLKKKNYCSVYVCCSEICKWSLYAWVPEWFSGLCAWLSHRGQWFKFSQRCISRPARERNAAGLEDMLSSSVSPHHGKQEHWHRISTSIYMWKQKWWKMTNTDFRIFQWIL